MKARHGKTSVTLLQQQQCVAWLLLQQLMKLICVVRLQRSPCMTYAAASHILAAAARQASSLSTFPLTVCTL